MTSSSFVLSLTVVSLLALATAPTAARPAHELEFLLGHWALEVSRDTGDWLGSTSAIELSCSAVDVGLDCQISSQGNDVPLASLTVRRAGGRYEVALVGGGADLRGRGLLERADTFVVEGLLGDRPARLWCLAVPPGRRLQLYLEADPGRREAAPIFEAVGRLDTDRPAPPGGRSYGDRSIVLSAVVEAPVAEVFRAFVQPELADRFFGLASRIDGRVGATYEIDFLPASHPASRENSSTGARLLAREDGRSLSFEWSAPPMVAHLNTDPLPTWVEITFSEAPGPGDATSILLEHHGFLRGEDWDFNYEFFVRGWSNILWRLQQAARLGLLE